MIGIKIEKIIFLMIVIGCFSGYCVRAQQVHRYTLASSQPPVLSADAGNDIYSEAGNTEILGGDPVATGGTPPYHYRWQPGEGLSDSEAISPGLMTGLQDITYSLTVTDSRRCTATDTITVFGIITSKTDEKINMVSVYPNPVQTLLAIQTGLQSGGLTLFNNRGETVLAEVLMSPVHYIDTSALSKGIYFLKVYAGRDEYTERIFVR